MKRRWEIHYKNWCITRDPYGTLACYYIPGNTLQWCYFGCSLDVIKREIDLRTKAASREV